MNDSIFVAIYIAATTLPLATVGGLTVIFLQRRRRPIKSVIRANAALCLVALLPAIGGVFFGLKWATFFVIWVGIVSFPFFLIAILAVNIALAISSKEAVTGTVQSVTPGTPDGGATGEEHAELPGRTRKTLFISLRLLYLYVVATSGFFLGVEVALRYSEGAIAIALLLTLVYLAVLTPALVIGLLPTKFIVGSNLLVRSWIILVLSSGVLSFGYKAFLSISDMQTRMERASVTRGTVCYALEGSSDASHHTPAIDISRQGGPFHRLQRRIEVGGINVCDNLSIDDFSPLTFRVYSLTEQNRNLKSASPEDSPTEPNRVEIPEDGEVCVFISPAPNARDDAPHWKVRVLRKDKRSLSENLQRILSGGKDICLDRD